MYKCLYVKVGEHIIFYDVCYIAVYLVLDHEYSYWRLQRQCTDEELMVKKSLYNTELYTFGACCSASVPDVSVACHLGN